MSSRSTRLAAVQRRGRGRTGQWLHQDCPGGHGCVLFDGTCDCSAHRTALTGVWRAQLPPGATLGWLCADQRAVALGYILVSISGNHGSQTRCSLPGAAASILRNPCAAQRGGQPLHQGRIRAGGACWRRTARRGGSAEPCHVEVGDSARSARAWPLHLPQAGACNALQAAEADGQRAALHDRPHTGGARPDVQPDAQPGTLGLPRWARRRAAVSHMLAA